MTEYGQNYKITAKRINNGCFVHSFFPYIDAISLMVPFCLAYLRWFGERNTSYSFKMISPLRFPILQPYHPVPEVHMYIHGNIEFCLSLVHLTSTIRDPGYLSTKDIDKLFRTLGIFYPSSVLSFVHKWIFTLFNCHLQLINKLNF